MKEQDLQKGAIKRSKIVAKWHRARRPHIDRHVAKASVPFNWQTGVDHTQGIKIKDQAGSGSCGGQAGSYGLNVIFGQEISAKSIYAPGHANGGGMTVPSLEYQICQVGANQERIVPSYKPDGTTDEAWMTDISYRNNTLNVDALTKAGWTAVSVPRNAESIAQAIRDHGFVIWEIAGQNGLTPSWLSVTPSVPISNQDLWYHYMCGAKAYLKNGVKTIRFFQSWGLGAGEGGLQDFDDKYITSKYIIDCFTFVRTETLTQQKTNIFQALIAWYKMLIGA